MPAYVGYNIPASPATDISILLTTSHFRSEECLQSIYRSTTFVFTDMRAIQMWFGHCQLHPLMKAWPKLGSTPPGFYKYARSVELSLSPEFPALLLCANLSISRLERRHAIYDFHWLWLNKFKNLRTLNIWILARTTTWSITDGERSYYFTGITELDVGALRDVLAHLRCVASVTLSTPLGRDIGPDYGYVEGVNAEQVTGFILRFTSSSLVARLIISSTQAQKGASIYSVFVHSDS